VVPSTYSANPLYHPRHQPGIVRTRTVQPPVTQTIMARRLRFFGHIVRSDSDEDHKRALIDDPPKYWRRPRGRPRQTWLRSSYNRKRPETTELGSEPCGLPGTEHRKLWREIVETATLLQGHTIHDDDDEMQHLNFSLLAF